MSHQGRVMNTFEKVALLSKKNRELTHNINELTKQLTINNLAVKKLIKRVTSLEEVVVDKLEDIFTGEDSPLYDIEQRIKSLEKDKQLIK